MFNLKCLIILFFISFPLSAETLTGKVVAIADGDTFTMLTGTTQTKVRLSEIDTPEKRQAFGNKAKQALAALIFDKTVDVDVVTIDRYKRTVGRVYVDGLDVNAKLVQDGYAWVYRRYAKDESLYDLEAEAKAARRGLWADKNPLPPWEFRHKNK